MVMDRSDICYFSIEELKLFKIVNTYVYLLFQ